MELLGSRFGTIDDSPTGVLVFRRSSTPFLNNEEMVEFFGTVNRVLDERGRPRSSLVVDTRDAPPRNDPAFEQAFAPLRARMLRGFRRVAVVVATPVGRLQVERHAREDHVPVRAFASDTEAIAYCSQRRLNE